MTVRFFRIEVRGTDGAKVQAIKTWFDSKVEANDLSDHPKCKISSGFLEPDETLGETEYLFTADLYIKASVSMNKYKDFIVDRWSALNKTGLTSARVIQYDNCSHDSDNPQPCTPDIRLEWNA